MICAVARQPCFSAAAERFYFFFYFWIRIDDDLMRFMDTCTRVYAQTHTASSQQVGCIWKTFELLFLFFLHKLVQIGSNIGFRRIFSALGVSHQVGAIWASKDLFLFRSPPIFMYVFIFRIHGDNSSPKTRNELCCACGTNCRWINSRSDGWWLYIGRGGGIDNSNNNKKMMKDERNQ